MTDKPIVIYQPTEEERNIFIKAQISKQLTLLVADVLAIPPYLYFLRRKNISVASKLGFVYGLGALFTAEMLGTPFVEAKYKKMLLTELPSSSGLRNLLENRIPFKMDLKTLGVRNAPSQENGDNPQVSSTETGTTEFPIRTSEPKAESAAKNSNIWDELRKRNAPLPSVKEQPVEPRSEAELEARESRDPVWTPSREALQDSGSDPIPVPRKKNKYGDDVF